MDLIRDIKLRLGYRAETLDFSDESIALLLQMGWVKKFMGRYIFTRRGVEEFKAYIQECLKEDKI